MGCQKASRMEPEGGGRYCWRGRGHVFWPGPRPLGGTKLCCRRARPATSAGCSNILNWKCSSSCVSRLVRLFLAIYRKAQLARFHMKRSKRSIARCARPTTRLLPLCDSEEYFHFAVNVYFDL